MPRTYFEPENFQALARVFQEARLILENRNEADPATLDFVAYRIFALASKGMTPALILANVLNTSSKPEDKASQAALVKSEKCSDAASKHHL